MKYLNLSQNFIVNSFLVPLFLCYSIKNKRKLHRASANWPFRLQLIHNTVGRENLQKHVTTIFGLYT